MILLDGSAQLGGSAHTVSVGIKWVAAVSQALSWTWNTQDAFIHMSDTSAGNWLGLMTWSAFIQYLA